LDVAPVSVVIPAYNSKEFIGAAVTSVRAQTLPVSEIIVIDDGSTDGTADIAAQLGVRVIRSEHRGISAARNIGIREAQHEWIAFQDADDLWEPEKLECQWQASLLYPDVGLVSCDLVQWVIGEAKPTAGSSRYDDAAIRASLRYIPEVNGSLAESIRFNSPAMLIRRELLLSVGLFDEDIEYVEGVECYLRIMARCAVVLVELPLVIQRIHQANTSANSVGMRLSWIKMVDAIRAQPDKYPAGAAQVLGKDIFEQLLPLGQILLAAGKTYEARELLRRSIKQRPSARALWWWTASFFPGPGRKRERAASDHTAVRGPSTSSAS